MQSPPKVNGGDRRPMSDHCDIIIHDTDDGVYLVAENRDKMEYTMRFDFGESENLKLKAASDIESVGEFKCNLVVAPGAVKNICELAIADTVNMDHFEMKYKVQCLIKNSKGELEEIHPSSGGGGGGEVEAGEEDEEIKEITKDLKLIIQTKADHSYVLFFQATGTDHHKVQMDFSESFNLTPSAGPNVTQNGMQFSTTVKPGKKIPFVKMAVTDMDKGSCSLEYKMRHSVDEEAKKKAAEEEAATKKKAEEEEAARKKAEEDAAAKKKAEAEANKKKAEEEEAARKKAEEDAAAKKKAEAEAEAKRKAEEETRLEAAKKAAEEEARKKAEADVERIKLLMAKAEEEQMALRFKIVAEYDRWLLLFYKQWRESMCNLCRQPFKAGDDITSYKIYRLHKPCYDKCPKCDQCGEVLVGEYVVSKGDAGTGVKLHKDCIDAYKKRSRPTCGDCGKQIMESSWTTHQGKPYHTSCRAQT